ncbi:MAG TPA: hypothetical protein VFJ66_04510 [Gaiellales bacterium]|nr:hypothetical protein [Gaiellales bacterium]
MRALRVRHVGLVAVAAAMLACVAVPASGAVGGGAKHSAVLRHLNRMAAAQVNPAAETGDQGDNGGEASDIVARSEYEAAIESAPTFRVKAQQLLAAQKAANRLPSRPGAWHPLTDRPFLDDPVPGYGPELYSNWGNGHGYVSGRMTGLAASGGAIFASGADGGVWKSTDRGAHWVQWSNGLPRLATGALETNPKDGSVWVGLGEANQGFENLPGFGIYRLAAGSSHWVRVGGSEVTSRSVFHIRFIGTWAFAATDHGLYRHIAGTAAGRWQLVMHLDPNPTHSLFRTSPVSDVAAVPGTNGHQVLAVEGDPGSFSEPATSQYNGFYLSRRGGSAGTFHKITPTGDINPKEIGRTTLSGTWGKGPLYAVVEDSATEDLLGQGVFVSENGNPAGPWKLIADVTKLAHSGSVLSDQPDQYHPGIQSWYNQYVQIDPRNPKHVYLGLEEIFETTDGGATWLAIGPYWEWGRPCAQTNPYNCPPTTHPDQHAVTIANGQAYFGNDGGVWRRSLSDHRAAGWTDLNRTLHTLQYYSADSGRIPGSDGIAVYGGMQDNGASLLLPNGRFFEQFTGDGGDVLVDPMNAANVMNEYVYLDVAVSNNYGMNDVEATPACGAFIAPIKGCDKNQLFIAPMERDSRNARHLVIGGQYVWQSWKGFATRCAGDQCDWKKAHDVGTPGDAEAVSAIGVRGSTIYAGWVGQLDPHPGKPFTRGISTNAGGRWHELSMRGLPNRYITSLTVDPKNPMHAYMTFGGYFATIFPTGRYGHVWETMNGGRTWHNISGNLPNAPLHKLALWHGKLVVGGDVGVFVAGAHGGSWHRLGGNLPRVTVWDLNVAPGGGFLIAATHGRGQWAFRP